MTQHDMREAQNTDTHLWRESSDYYAPRIFATMGGGIGIEVGGTAFVKPAREWHRLAALSAAPEADTILRELVKAVRSVNTEQESKNLASDWPAWAAAFAWADAQKAPQPRTAEPAEHQFEYGSYGYQCQRCGQIWHESNGVPANGPCRAAEPAPAPADEPPPLLARIAELERDAARQPLSEQALAEMWNEATNRWVNVAAERNPMLRFARAVEQAHGIGVQPLQEGEPG
jgi:hypothetical protein